MSWGKSGDEKKILRWEKIFLIGRLEGRHPGQSWKVTSLTNSANIYAGQWDTSRKNIRFQPQSEALLIWYLRGEGQALLLPPRLPSAHLLPDWTLPNSGKCLWLHHKNRPDTHMCRGVSGWPVQNHKTWLSQLSFGDNKAIPLGFSGSSDGKEFACNVGDLGSIPGLGRSSGEGNGYPPQYSCLENPMDRGAWWVIVHGVAESDTTKQLTLSLLSKPSLY